MNLFFVSTPFQIINAMEAISFYQCQNNVVIYREPENELSKQQMDKLLAKHDWLTIIKPLSKAKFSISPKLVNLLNQLKAVNPSMVFEKVFYTEYPSRFIATMLSNISISDKEVMFDDGTWTLKAFEEHLKDNVPKSYPNFKRNLLLNLFGYKKPHTFHVHEKFELFTIFDLTSDRFVVSKNNFAVLKNEQPQTESISSESSSIMVMIGDGGTDMGLSLVLYKKAIAELATQTQKLVYFPHRNEKQHVRELLQDIPNLEYATQTNLPIELAIRQYQNITAIYGFYSTALFTLATLFDTTPIYTRKLSDDELNNSSKLKLLSNLVQKYLAAPNVNEWTAKDN
jgi:hypothetical protein